MEIEELKQFKKLFRGVDLYTPKEMAEWFRSYPELTALEHCSIIGRSPNTIECTVRQCGLNSVAIVEVDDKWIVSRVRAHNKGFNNRRTYQYHEIDKDWVIAQYLSGKSVNWLRLTCRCSTDKIRNILTKNGIKLRRHGEAVKSNNIYCNKDWVMAHYVNKKLPMGKCAKLAGVSEGTIGYWAMKFGIDIRCSHEIGDMS